MAHTVQPTRPMPSAATLSRFALPLLSLIACAAACSSTTIIHEGPSTTDTPDSGDIPDDDGGDTPDSSTPDTYSPPPTGTTFPQVLSRGGKVIASPKVVPIVFQGDAMTSQITSFTQKLGASEFWATQAAEYGVGAITPGSTVTLTEAAPTSITTTAIETWLTSKFNDGTLGTPDANTLYAIYYPASTTIADDGSGLGQSCQGYGGYHYELAVKGVSVGYAVLPRCADIDELTIAASHEYFEWATDPFPATFPAFNKLDDAHWAWGVVMFGELGDLCTYEDQDNLRSTEIGFEIQRMWSNKASKAGSYPCAPVNTRPYFAAIPSATDDVQVQDQQDGSALTTKAINVAPGKTRTVDVLVYSDHTSTAAVPLRALSYADFGQSSQPSGFTYALSKQMGTPGEKVQVTITAPSANNYDFLVMMAQTSDQTAFYWPVLVTNEPTSIRSQGSTAIRTRMPRTTKLGLLTSH